jgi:hypothetical protein
MVAAGIGGAIGSGALGKVGNVDQPGTSESAFWYGGRENYYNKLRQRLEEQEAGAQNRASAQADFGRADQDYTNAGNARTQQQQLIDQYGNVVNGTAGPSLAEQQMRAGQTQAGLQAMQMAAATRGGTANQLAAQRSAMQQQAIGLGQVNRNAGLLRAQEVQQARDAQAGLIGAMRQQDYQSRAGSQQQALGQAGLEMQQRALNDQRSMGLLGAQEQATQASMQGRMAYEQLQQQGSEWAQGQDAQIDQLNKQRNAQFWGSILGAGGALMGKGAGGLWLSIATAQTQTEALRSTMTLPACRRAPLVQQLRSALRSLTRKLCSRSDSRRWRRADCHRCHPGQSSNYWQLDHQPQHRLMAPVTAGRLPSMRHGTRCKDSAGRRLRHQSGQAGFQ